MIVVLVHCSAGQGGLTWNYRSNFGWAGLAGVGSRLQPADKVEQMMFVCHAMNISCTCSDVCIHQTRAIFVHLMSCTDGLRILAGTRPAPTPAPTPAHNLSPKCEATVRDFCGATAPRGCQQCVVSHRSEEVAAGCPQGAGAAAEVIRYCETL